MTKKSGAGIAFGIIGAILVAIAVWPTNVAASDQHADPGLSADDCVALTGGANGAAAK